MSLGICRSYSVFRSWGAGFSFAINGSCISTELADDTSKSTYLTLFFVTVAAIVSVHCNERFTGNLWELKKVLKEKMIKHITKQVIKRRLISDGRIVTEFKNCNERKYIGEKKKWLQGWKKECRTDLKNKIGEEQPELWRAACNS